MFLLVCNELVSLTFCLCCQAEGPTGGDEEESEKSVSEVNDEDDDEEPCREPPFQYVNHVRTYPTFMFGGSVGSRVATVAFLRK